MTDQTTLKHTGPVVRALPSHRIILLPTIMARANMVLTDPLEDDRLGGDTTEESVPRR